jgi:hypothetical protein
MSDSISTRFILKTCGQTFEDQSNLNQHINDFHHPKRTVTISDIVNSVFEGRINFPGLQGLGNGLLRLPGMRE